MSLEEKIRKSIQKWRDDAEWIRREYGDGIPHDRECVAITVEQTADELETLLENDSK